MDYCSLICGHCPAFSGSRQKADAPQSQGLILLFDVLINTSASIASCSMTFHELNVPCQNQRMHLTLYHRLHSCDTPQLIPWDTCNGTRSCRFRHVAFKKRRPQLREPRYLRVAHEPGSKDIQGVLSEEPCWIMLNQNHKCQAANAISDAMKAAQLSLSAVIPNASHTWRIQDSFDSFGLFGPQVRSGLRTSSLKPLTAWYCAKRWCMLKLLEHGNYINYQWQVNDIKSKNQCTWAVQPAASQIFSERTTKTWHYSKAYGPFLTHYVTKDPLDRFSALFDCYIGDNSDNFCTKRESSVILPIASEITTLSGIGVGLGVNLRCHSRMACLDTRADVPLSDTCAVRMKACKSSKFCLPQEHETNNPLVCPAEPVKHVKHPTHQKACLQIVGQVFMFSCDGSFFRWQTFNLNDFQFTKFANIYIYI